MNPLLPIQRNNDRLRLHQIEAKEKVFQAWEQLDSVMLQMPTGTGKTFLFCSLIRDIVGTYKALRKEINILIVVHRMELIEQISGTLTHFNIPHGIIQGPTVQHLWRRVQVASIMSILTERNYMNTLRQKYDFIIVDEAHHSLAQSYVDLFNLFPNAKKLGVTATPWRHNRESFLNIYQSLITSRPISWFISNGILSDFEYISIRPDSEIQTMVNDTEIASTGDFVNQELDLRFNNMRIRSKLLKSYLRFAKGRKGIIYAINRRHAVQIAELYSQNGVSAVAIDCETPKDERMRIIRDFKAGKIKVLVNVDIFTEGFDCPDVSFIQLARPTRSLALYLQQVGRGLRKAEGKQKTIIIDNVGLYNYFGLPDADRKWQYHFKGQLEEGFTKADFHIPSTEPSAEAHSDTDQNDRFEENDEEMVMVHGTIKDSVTDNSLPYDSNVVNGGSTDNHLENEEFIIADYYLVRGNRLHFKVYPFVKRKGIRTEGVSSPVYEYDHSSGILEFSSDSSRNEEMVKENLKLHTFLSFSAVLMNIDLHKILNPCLMDGMNIDKDGNISLFDILKTLSQMSDTTLSRHS